MKTLEVGDQIRVKNWMNNFVVTINRVTKTKAIGSWGENGKNIFEFKRVYYSTPNRYNKIKWEQTEYTLLDKH